MKQYGSKDEYFDDGDGLEDSDCEGVLDQAEHSVTETEVGGGEQSGQGDLSILSIGSFSR